MAKIQYNGMHAGPLKVEGYTFKQGINEVDDNLLNDVLTKWMLKNKHFILIPETKALKEVKLPVAAPKLTNQTEESYLALEAKKNTKTAALEAKKLAAAKVIAEAAAKKAAAKK